MIIRGNWFPPNSAASQPATLKTSDSGLTLQGEAEQIWQGAANDVIVSSRLGNIPRKLTFESGAVFVTQDNDSVDQWLKQSSHRAHKAGFLHALESRWHWVFLSLIATVAFVFICIGWGLPLASEKIAKSLPAEANNALSSGTLATLDRVYSNPEKRHQQNSRNYAGTSKKNFSQKISRDLVSNCISAI